VPSKADVPAILVRRADEQHLTICVHKQSASSHTRPGTRPGRPGVNFTLHDDDLTGGNLRPGSTRWRGEWSGPGWRPAGTRTRRWLRRTSPPTLPSYGTAGLGGLDGTVAGRIDQSRHAQRVRVSTYLVGVAVPIDRGNPGRSDRAGRRPGTQLGEQRTASGEAHPVRTYSPRGQQTTSPPRT
jgi:hypothetical protein